MANELPLPRAKARHPSEVIGDTCGAVLVEAAFAFPILIVLLLGVVTYGMWFAAAHSLQETANGAARATLGSLSAAERSQQVARAVDEGLGQSGLVNKSKVTTHTDIDGSFLTITLDYDISNEGLFTHSIVPLPGTTISRSAVVEVTS